MMLGAAAGILQAFASCQPSQRQNAADTARPLSSAEAVRLAGMRLRNFRDGRSGVRATIGPPGREVRLSGWVDWRQPLAYLSVVSPAVPTAGPPPGDSTDGLVTGLIQAVPGVVAVREATDHLSAEPTTATRAPAFAPPPVPPPDDGWRVRPMALADPARAPLDAFVGLLLTTASPGPDDADVLSRSSSRWIRRDLVRGVPVDVLLGPAVPPAIPADAAPTDAAPASGEPSGALPAPRSLAAMGGAVRYWLDAGSRLHRLEALLAHGLPVRADLLRADRSAPTAIAFLGGRPISPERVTRAEAVTLATLPRRGRGVGGGAVNAMLPARDGGVIRAGGWLDWRTAAAYLRLTGSGYPGPGTIVWADRRGLTAVPGIDGADVGPRSGASRQGAGMPPVPPPDSGWSFTPWPRRTDATGRHDLHLMLTAALAAGAARAGGQDRGTVAAIRASAIRLRADTVDDAPVTVYEMRRPDERQLAPGQARLRYWVDPDGLLRRLELRNSTGGFGRLDIVPGQVPPLGAVAPAATGTTHG